MHACSCTHQAHDSVTKEKKNSKPSEKFEHLIYCMCSQLLKHIRGLILGFYRYSFMEQ